MKQTMSEKLRLIADCLKNGKTVQSKEICAAGATPKNWSDDYDVTNNPLYDIVVYAMCNYRAKPDKPRISHVSDPLYDVDHPLFYYNYEAIELTSEVKKALDDAGIEYD